VVKVSCATAPYATSTELGALEAVQELQTATTVYVYLFLDSPASVHEVRVGDGFAAVGQFPAGAPSFRVT
jgi:hypothetical protein